MTIQPAGRELIHRNALAAALRKAAILERLDPRGDPYGAAGQALEDFVKREDQIVANGEDVSGWISTATERRWINELRYQSRRGYDRLDAPRRRRERQHARRPDAPIAGPAIHDLVELRERLQRHRRRAARRARAPARGGRARASRADRRARARRRPACTTRSRTTVNAEFADWSAAEILGNTVTQIIGRQRERLAAAGAFPTVVARLRGPAAPRERRAVTSARVLG